jgi:hypothetical protein
MASTVYATTKIVELFSHDLTITVKISRKDGMRFMNQKEAKRADVEKAIEWLKRFLEYMYARRKYDKTVRYAKLSIKALEKQIERPCKEDNILACYNCKSGEYLVNQDENWNSFCGQCGQKLDIEDIEYNSDYSRHMREVLKEDNEQWNDEDFRTTSKEKALENLRKLLDESKLNILENLIGYPRETLETLHYAIEALEKELKSHSKYTDAYIEQVIADINLCRMVLKGKWFPKAVFEGKWIPANDSPKEER